MNAQRIFNALIFSNTAASTAAHQSEHDSSKNRSQMKGF